MSTRRQSTLGDLMRLGGEVEARCGYCGRVATFSAASLVDWVGAGAEPHQLRFRCRSCGAHVYGRGKLDLSDPLLGKVGRRPVPSKADPLPGGMTDAGSPGACRSGDHPLPDPLERH